MPGGVGSACVMHGERLRTDHALMLARLDQHGVRFEESVARMRDWAEEGNQGLGASAPSLGQPPYSEESDVDGLHTPNDNTTLLGDLTVQLGVQLQVQNYKVCVCTY